jgi:fido (protein-threonine AMPylation protein)
MRRVPSSFDELIALLRNRHAKVLGGRPEKRPGEFKTRINRAGTTEFVAPDLVRGTLARGFELARPLEDPFGRAVFMMFLVSEVHPFDDGNGRLARIMMNAELEAAGETRIIIPTIFRNEYLSGLRALTHNGRPNALVTVLDFAQRYTRQIDFSNHDAAKAQLAASNAFVDSTDAEQRGLRLTLIR